MFEYSSDKNLFNELTLAYCFVIGGLVTSIYVKSSNIVFTEANDESSRAQVHQSRHVVGDFGLD